MGEEDAVSEKIELVANGKVEGKTEAVKDKKGEQPDDLAEMEEDKQDEGKSEPQQMDVDKEEANGEKAEGAKVAQEEGIEKTKKEEDVEKQETVKEDGGKEEVMDEKIEEEAEAEEDTTKGTDEKVEEDDKSKDEKDKPEEPKGSKKRPRSKTGHGKRDETKKKEPAELEKEQIVTPSQKKTKESKPSVQKRENEPKTPSAFAMERPVRERKSVERLVATIEKDSSKGFRIEKGRGNALKDIPNVAYKLSRKKNEETLKLLHTILFGRRGKIAQVKINISRFSGFVWHDNEEKQTSRLKEKLDKCVKERLIEFCDVLDVPISKASAKKEEIVAKLMEFFMEPHATTSDMLAEKEQGTKRKRSTKSASGSSTPSKGSVKCTTIPHDKVDRISQLPNEIILVVLSFLSMREAAATSILSRRWSYLWKHTSNLNFKKKSLNLRPRIETNREGKYWDAKECRYIALVNSVLQSHEALSLKKFKVSFYVNRSAHNIVSKWLEFVFSRQVETLKLDFRCMVTIHKVVLEEILRGSIISPIFFKSLKSLCLKSFKVSGEDIKLFLRNCPLLERLIIHYTLLMSDVEVCGANLRLNHLDLSNCSCKGSIVKISAPNLTWIGLDDRLAGKLLLDRKFSKLVGASLVHGILRPDVVQNFASTISRFIFQLKTLRLILHRPEVFLANRFPELPNLSKLVIEYFGDYKQLSILNGTALIWACPRLQEFTFKFINIIEKPNVGAEATANVECSPHQHIRVFEFIGFSAGVEGHMELVTYMVNKCAALQKIIIGHEPYLPDRSKSADERLASEVYAKQKLQGKVPNHIQLQLYNYRC